MIHFIKHNPINSSIANPSSEQEPFESCVITIVWHQMISNMMTLKMFPVFTQLNCCLGINVWAATHTVWLRANLLFCHLPAIQAHRLSRGNLLTLCELYWVVTTNAWIGCGLPSWYFENNFKISK